MKMNWDAIFAFATSIVTEIGSVFSTDPHVTLAVQIIGGILAVLGSALHLDGK